MIQKGLEQELGMRRLGGFLDWAVGLGVDADGAGFDGFADPVELGEDYVGAGGERFEL